MMIQIQKLRYVFLFILSYHITSGQQYWTPVHTISNSPNHYYNLDSLSFLYRLHHHLPVQIPLPGISETWITMEARSNFSPELAAKYPSIKSYRSTNTSATIYLDEYNDQIHIFQRTATETYFIEPKEDQSNQYEILTSTSLLMGSTKLNAFNCKTIDHEAPHRDGISSYRDNQIDKINLKTYRLALALTAEFAFTLGNTNEKILAGLNSHLTRINAVYIHENAIEFKLVPNNDTLIFTNVSSQPYSNGQVDKMITENLAVLNARIGLNNYDIGHVFGTNDGGLAQLATVCGANKAAAASCSFGIYTNLLFYTIPCHEIGHQFNATHIFNFCDNSNETSSSAFEPGSGSTIMSYAGASNCGQNYVQEIQDPYFHAYSLQQIKTFSRSGIGSLCGVSTPTSNEPPQVAIVSPINVTIPKSTPFELEGIGMDDKTTDLNYTWEEMDLGQKSILGMPIGNAPLFRSIPPSLSPIRTFPSLEFLLNNKSRISEVLPTISRPLTFRFSSRDNEFTGGGTDWIDISYQSTALAGPFVMTALNDPITLFRHDAQYITWDVANTSSSTVNCKAVDILWSKDGGNNFTTILSKSTPNDGGEWITIPDQKADNGRIKIKSAGNIFFDVNNSNLKVSDQLNPNLKLTVSPDQISMCAGTEMKQYLYSSHSSSTDTLSLITAMQQDEPISISFSKNWLVKDDSVLMTIRIKSLSKPEDQIIKIFGVNRRTKDTVTLEITLKITSDHIILIQPMQDQDQVATVPLFKWQSIPNAEDYILEVSEVPTFQVLTWSKILLDGDTSAISDIPLNANQIYFWRIRPLLGCMSSASNFVAFHTQALICKTYFPTDIPKFISATGAPRITSEINIADSINISLITIPILRGSHDFIADLAVSLHSPSGDSSVLWSKQCNNLSNFNLGFDDQAAIALTCPLTDRKTHRPEQPLSKLQPSGSKGIWKLIIQDNNNGAGGSLDDWFLQLCGAITEPGPSLKTNSGLELFELKTKNIGKEILETVDLDSDASKLKYVLLQNPSKGMLFLDGVIQTIGSSFTQEEINAGKLNYNSFAVTVDTVELITFYIVDEKNNWSGVQVFKIKILNDPTLAANNTASDNILKVYPNPFGNYIILENHSRTRINSLLFTLEGKLIRSFDLGPGITKRYDLHLAYGVYFLKYVCGNGKSAVQKLISR